MAPTERVLVEIVARDLGSLAIREFNDNLDRIGVRSNTASREASRGFDRITESARQNATRTSGIWQDANGMWRRQTGEFASQAERDFEGVSNAARSSARRVNDAGDEMSSGFDRVTSKLGAVAGALAAAFAVDKIKDFAADAVNLASDTQEASTKLQAVFGDGTDAVNAFADQGAKALGQTGLQIKDAAATFGVFGRAAGLAGTANADFSTKLVGLSTDLASFYNVDPQEAVDALSAGLRGEAEPLRKFGILMDDATLRNKALQMGLITTTKDALQPNQKVLAAQALIMEQTSVAQGDFARTSGGLANQQRILAAQWGDMKARLGQAFLPGVTAVVTALNNVFMPVISKAAEAVPKFIGQVSAAFAILRTGDFVGGSGLGEEDSPLVVALLKAHDVYLTVENFLFDAWQLLKTGDFIGGSLGGAEEDSRLVSNLLAARDAYYTVKGAIIEAWNILAHGDFVGGQGFQEDSPFVTLIFNLRDYGLETFEKLKGIFSSLWDTAEKLWPSIQSIATSLGEAFATLSGSGLNIGELIFGGMLDGTQVLADALNTALIPAFDWIAAFMRDNPQVVLTLVGAFVLYKGIMLGVTIATQAYEIAQKAAAVATRIFNAVVNASPIMKIVTLLGLLAAAVVWAYNNVDWFRNLVDTVWNWLGPFISNIWENWIKPAFTQFGEVLSAVGNWFSWLWNDIIVPVWQNAIAPAISFVWNNIIKPYFEAWWAAIQLIGTVVSWLWNSVIVPVWQNAIAPAIDYAWNQIIKPAWDGFWNAVDAAGKVVQWLWDSVISPTWNGLIGPAIQSVWDNIIQPAWNGLKDFMSAVGSFFDAIWSGIGTAVTNVKQAITDITNDIKGFLGLSFGTGVQSNANGSVTVSGDSNPLTLPFNFNPPGGATGGQVRGPGTGTSDSILARVSDGEFIVKASATQRFLPELQAINSYAAGGLVEAGWDKGYHAVYDYAKPGLDAAGAEFKAKYAPAPAASGGAMYTGPLGGGVEQWRGLGLAVLAAVGAYKGLQLTQFIPQMLNQIRTESSGNPNAINTTDINAQRGDPSIGLLQVIGATFRSALSGTPFAYLIARGQRDPEASLTASTLYSLNRYGTLDKAWRGVAYDQGGLWPSGTVGFNASGRTEMVLNPDQTAAAMAGAGGGRTVTIAPGAVQINVNGTMTAHDRAALRRDLEATLRDILAEDEDRRF